MNKIGFQVPVVLVVFNRPDNTAIALAAIKKVQPAQLFIVADGPRHNDERIKTDAVKQLLEVIDWPCEVFRNYATENMGCRMRLATGISWVFEQVEQAIILEDDCVPHPDFFIFCSAMLQKYQGVNEVMHISGNSFLPAHINLPHSYYFTNYTFVWGWATWRRAWQQYDLEMNEWENILPPAQLIKKLGNQYAAAYWKGCFSAANAISFDSWDYQWTYSVWKAGGIAIAPSKNLVSNNGFDHQATHTKQANPLLSYLPTYPLDTLIHPEKIKVNKQADHWIRDHVYSPPPPSIFQRIAKKIKRIFQN